jgi:hypothetical protein
VRFSACRGRCAHRLCRSTARQARCCRWRSRLSAAPGRHRTWPSRAAPRGRSGNVRHWCPVMCPCAGAPAIYTQRVLRALASLVSGREMTSDAELLDGVAMVRVPAVRAEARSGAPSSSGAWHSSEIRGRSADPRVRCTGNGAHGRVRFRHHHVGRQGGE